MPVQINEQHGRQPHKKKRTSFSTGGSTTEPPISSLYRLSSETCLSWMLVLSGGEVKGMCTDTLPAMMLTPISSEGWEQSPLEIASSFHATSTARVPRAPPKHLKVTWFGWPHFQPATSSLMHSKQFTSIELLLSALPFLQTDPEHQKPGLHRAWSIYTSPPIKILVRNFSFL